MIYQDLTIAISKTQKRFTQNPNSSVSALFRNLRNDDRLSLIGDYPLLATIINTLTEMGIPVKKSAVQRTIRKESSELKRQKTLLGQLLTPHMMIRKRAKLSNSTPDLSEKTTTSLKNIGGNNYGT